MAAMASSAMREHHGARSRQSAIGRTQSYKNRHPGSAGVDSSMGRPARHAWRLRLTRCSKPRAPTSALRHSPASLAVAQFVGLRADEGGVAHALHARRRREGVVSIARVRIVVCQAAATGMASSFDILLSRFADLHDFSKPLVVADYDHAIDTRRWMLRLCPQASGAAQMAALLHDVERLESEADARVEHLAPNYALFKQSHARRGGQIARALLEDSGIDRATADRVAELVVDHERSRRDPDVALLNDADALSFFSLNSAGYLDYFGWRQTVRKIAYSLERMSAAAAAHLDTITLRADVASLLTRVRVGA
jgi:hypothetical protein